MDSALRKSKRAPTATVERVGLWSRLFGGVEGIVIQVWCRESVCVRARALVTVQV